MDLERHQVRKGRANNFVRRASSTARHRGNEYDFIALLDPCAPIAEIPISGTAKGVEFEGEAMLETEFLVETRRGAGE